MDNSDFFDAAFKNSPHREFYSTKPPKPEDFSPASAVGESVWIKLDKSNIYNPFAADVYQEAALAFTKKKDDTIRAALVREGIDPDDHEFIKNNCQRVIQEGDAYEHYMVGDKRIISIERHPAITQDGNTFNISCKFY